MGKDPKKAVLDEPARSFLECAAAGARGRDLSGPLEPLRPAMNEMIGRVYARRSQWAQCDEEDIRQEVYERLLRNPPTKIKESISPAATVFSWVKTTAQRIMIDKSKRARGLVFFDFDDSKEYAGTEDKLDAYTSVERKSILRFFLRMLEKESPALHNYCKVLVENPSLGTQELAGILNTSVANVDQLRCRLREFVLMFNEMMNEGKK